jgi:D-amino-acid oxidase
VLLRRVTTYTHGRNEPFPWHDVVDGYRELGSAELHPLYADAEAAEFLTWVVDTPRWLARMSESLRAREVTFVERHLEHMSELTGFDAAVNASGLGAAELVGDQTVARGDGHVVYVERPADLEDVFMNEVRREDAIADDPLGVNMAYLVPRARDVALGGTNFHDDRTSQLPAKVPGMLERICALATAIEPRLAGARVLDYRVAARPQRARGTRIEVEVETDALPIVHCYGTGGSGWTLAPGLAQEAVELLAGVLWMDRRAVG